MPNPQTPKAFTSPQTSLCVPMSDYFSPLNTICIPQLRMSQSPLQSSYLVSSALRSIIQRKAEAGVSQVRTKPDPKKQAFLRWLWKWYPGLVCSMSTKFWFSPA